MINRMGGSTGKIGGRLPPSARQAMGIKSPLGVGAPSSMVQRTMASLGGSLFGGGGGQTAAAAMPPVVAGPRPMAGPAVVPGPMPPTAAIPMPSQSPVGTAIANAMTRSRT